MDKQWMIKGVHIRVVEFSPSHFLATGTSPLPHHNELTYSYHGPNLAWAIKLLLGHIALDYPTWAKANSVEPLVDEYSRQRSTAAMPCLVERFRSIHASWRI